MSFAYPFAAVVGQESMKMALLLHTVDPSIGGVLVRGEKGTAKSTLVRSLAALLPHRESQVGCPYRCSPKDLERYPHLKISNASFHSIPLRVVDLPLNASQDRLVGSLDLDAAMARGEFRFRPGLLAEAHGNWLYIDEVNLLEDHLVDMLLDAAALGENIVEREGISLRHPCQFVLVGSMNPEEGELRPQLLDRFGLVVDVCAESRLEARVEIIRRRLDFDLDPNSFASSWVPENDLISRRISKARSLLSQVNYSESILKLVSRITLEMHVDGHRADLAILRAARAWAAWEGSTEVSLQNVLQAAQLALPHRMHKKAFDPSVFVEENWSVD